MHVLCVNRNIYCFNSNPIQSNILPHPHELANHCFIPDIFHTLGEDVVKQFRLYNCSTFILFHIKPRSRSDYHWGSSSPSSMHCQLQEGLHSTSATCSVTANCSRACEFNTCFRPANYNPNRIRIQTTQALSAFNGE